ncbi:MAG: heme ABC transporter ATP-binding protein [Nevskia sp.]|jgi:iron complex transport system ATP-binding protein|nr:heme ABC transporter ATP-binding protein [Nevskia sp.]
MSLRATNLSYLHSGRVILDQVSIRLEAGRVVALLGQNGAGKSTLLRLLAGELRPKSGCVELDQRRLGTWDPLLLARRRAVMMQREHLPFSFNAAQVVALGRLPWRQREDSASEQNIVAEALAAAGAANLAMRRYPTLSGGERARVQLARALAQIAPLPGTKPEPAYLLLDEPTASFDFGFQHDCLAAVRRLSRNNVGVLAILHDPNLALRYADTVALLHEHAIIATGAPDAVLTPERIEQVYGLKTARVDHAGDLYISAQAPSPETLRPAP